jgi:hypothetical protein
MTTTWATAAIQSRDWRGVTCYCDLYHGTGDNATANHTTTCEDKRERRVAWLDLDHLKDIVAVHGRRYHLTDDLALLTDLQEIDLTDKMSLRVPFRHPGGTVTLGRRCGRRNGPPLASVWVELSFVLCSSTGMGVDGFGHARP